MAADSISITVFFTNITVPHVSAQSYTSQTRIAMRSGYKKGVHSTIT